MDRGGRQNQLTGPIVLSLEAGICVVTQQDPRRLEVIESNAEHQWGSAMSVKGLNIVLEQGVFREG